MQIIFKWVVLKKEEYNKLKHDDEKVQEYLAIIKNTEIEKERLAFKRKYHKYLNKWFLMDDNIVIQIKDVKYNYNNFSWNKFRFEAFMPNGEDYIDIDLSDIEDKKLEPIAKKDVGDYLGIN